MNQKTTQYLLIAIIVVCVGVSGYLILKPNGNQAVTQGANGLAPVVNGKQLLQMTVYATNYSPSIFTVKAGIPVRWEITSSGQPGCDSGAIVANNLVPGGSIVLNPNQGQTVAQEFTPETPGTYRFACPMGMVWGSINVVN